MRPLNVHALNLAAFVAGSIIIVLFAAERPFVQATMAIAASGFALASVVTFWWIEATYPEGEVFARFKSALADYATFWTTVGFFFAIIMTGRLPTA